MSKAIKVTIEEVDGKWTTRHGKTYSHDVNCSDMSRSKYIKLIKKNYPTYIVTNDVMIAPSNEDKVEEVNMEIAPAIHPVLKPDHFDKLTPELIKNIEKNNPGLTDVILDMVDEDTGEIITIDEDPKEKVTKIPDPIIVEVKPIIKTNTVKPQEMNTKTNATEKKVEEQPKKKNVIIKAGALTIGYSLMTVATPTHLALQTLADTFQGAANVVAKTEVFLIDKLGVLPEEIELTDGSKIPMTREIASEAVKARTKKIQSYALLPLTILKALKEGNQEESATPSVATS